MIGYRGKQQAADSRRNNACLSQHPAIMLNVDVTVTRPAKESVHSIAIRISTSSPG
jgi:hypothetical protein